MPPENNQPTAANRPIQLTDAVALHSRDDFAALRRDMTVAEALALIRRQGLGERIIYFYVVDADGLLAGVVPTRRLLTAEPDSRLMAIMIERVVAIPHTATVLEACEYFVLHKFLAFPVVDDDRRLVGVVDINLFTREVFDIAEREQADAAFEALGFHVAQVRTASPVQAFRFRFPWLVATIASGTLCAVLTGAFHATLERALVLAFFLPLVLGLAESVAIQSMTVTIQAVRVTQPSRRWYAVALRREALTAALLATGCSLLVGLIVWVWRGEGQAALAITAGLWLALAAACLFGLSVPAALHALRLDPKIAAGPLTLALTDVFTVLSYFTLAAVML